jgi:long-chain acyl-CoA synthetase
MILFNEISGNKQLRFIDASTPEQIYRLSDLSLIFIAEKERRLAFLYLDNSLASIIVLLSFLKSNQACVLLSPDLAQHFKEELETLYAPAFIYDRTRSSVTGYTLDESRDLFLSETPQRVEIDPSIKILLSTSGSTGSPKFVKLSEENLLENARSIAAYLPIAADDVTPLNLPVYYSYGLSVLTSNALKGGTVVCTTSDVLSKGFWDSMEQLGYTSIAGVPFVYEMLDRIGFTKKKYPSLRYFTQAGGRLREPLIRKFAAYAAEQNALFYVMYGQTEATARMAYLPPEKATEKPASIGIAIPGGTFDIDPENQELLYSGPNVCGGYVSRREDLAVYRQEAWLHTGDLGRIDEDGYYYITGRIKRFVKLFGNRINLDEVEQLLAADLNVSVKCTGIDDKIMLLVTDDKEMDEQAAAAMVVAGLKLHPTVIKTWIMDAIPLTANGKTDYGLIQKMYAER